MVTQILSRCWCLVVHMLMLLIWYVNKVLPIKKDMLKILFNLFLLEPLCCMISKDKFDCSYFTCFLCFTFLFFFSWRWHHCIGLLMPITSRCVFSFWKLVSILTSLTKYNQFYFYKVQPLLLQGDLLSKIFVINFLTSL